MVYLGLLLPIITLQILGAAAALAANAPALPSWAEGAAVSVPNLVYAMVGGGAGGRTVMVLLALSVTANTAPTIYSCGLSAMVVLPFLVRGESVAVRREEGG